MFNLYRIDEEKIHFLSQSRNIGFLWIYENLLHTERTQYTNLNIQEDPKRPKYETFNVFCSIRSLLYIYVFLLNPQHESTNNHENNKTRMQSLIFTFLHATLKRLILYFHTESSNIFSKFNSFISPTPNDNNTTNNRFLFAVKRKNTVRSVFTSAVFNVLSTNVHLNSLNIV